MLPPAGPAAPAGTAGEPRFGRVGAGFRVVLLLGLLAAVTVGGIALGKALTDGLPAHVAQLTTSATTVTTRRVVKPKPPVPWGPLPARPAGRLPVGGDEAAAVLAGSRLVVLGGRGSDAVVAGPAGGKLVRVGSLPGPRAAAAAFPLGRSVRALGGERGATPTDAILAIDPASGKVKAAGAFDEPLAEAGFVARNGSVYLVGGWTGSQYATAILEFVPPGKVIVIARLPEGTRSPAVALIGHTLFVAGGSTQAGLSRSVFAVDTRTGRLISIGKLPQAVDQGLLVASGPTLYLLGGRDAAGKAVSAIVRIAPSTGRIATVGQLPFPLAGASAVPDGTRTLVVVPHSGTVYRLG